MPLKSGLSIKPAAVAPEIRDGLQQVMNKQGFYGRNARRMSVQEIAERLDIGRQAVYAMLDQGILPGVRVGRRWIITRHAYEEWERTCGVRSGTGLQTQPEVTVLN